MKLTNNREESTERVLDNQVAVEPLDKASSTTRDVASVIDMLFELHSALNTGTSGPRTAASALMASKLVTPPVPHAPQDGKRDAEFDAMTNAKRMLECAICQDVFTAATETACCGQIYCRDCIKTWTDETASSCPMCRTELTFSMLTPARHVQRMANELVVPCPFCNTRVKKGTLADHEVTCVQAPVPVTVPTSLVLQRSLLAQSQTSSSAFRHFLIAPTPPQAEMSHCYIRCSGNTFALFAVEGDLCLATAVRSNTTNEPSAFVMALTLPSNDATDNHDEARHIGHLKRDSKSYQYTLDVRTPVVDNGSMWETCEMGAVAFRQDDGNSPKKMIAIIPTVMELDGNEAVTNQSGRRVSRWAPMLHAESRFSMRNKPPVWMDEMGHYCLDFGGRVKVASEKNFILTQPDHLETSLLVFGRTHDRNVFVMDFQHPLSPLQAFSIALSTIDSPSLEHLHQLVNSQ